MFNTSPKKVQLYLDKEGKSTPMSQCSLIAKVLSLSPPAPTK